LYSVAQDHINKTLAGVAQSVERVALTTARDKPQGRGFEPLLRLFLYQSHSWQLFFCFLVVSPRAQKHRVMLFLLLLTSRLMMPPFSINKENRYN
jgi:hypothetical protein